MAYTAIFAGTYLFHRCTENQVLVRSMGTHISHVNPKLHLALLVRLELQNSMASHGI